MKLTPSLFPMSTEMTISLAHADSIGSKNPLLTLAGLQLDVPTQVRGRRIGEAGAPRKPSAQMNDRGLGEWPRYVSWKVASRATPMKQIIVTTRSRHTEAKGTYNHLILGNTDVNRNWHGRTKRKSGTVVTPKSAL